MAVLAKDDRDLLNLHFLTLPATDSNSTELKINRSPITDTDLLNVWYWLIASGHTGFRFDYSVVYEPSSSPPIGFTPASLSGLQLWLDATDVDGDGQADSISNDSNVSLWVDKAGGDHNATQSNALKQPTYKTSQLNGRPSIQFNNSEWLYFNAINDVRTVFWVLSNDNDSQYGALLGHSGSHHFHPDGKRFWSHRYTSDLIKNGNTYLNGTKINGTTTNRPLGPFIVSLATTGNVVASRLNRDRNYDSYWKGKISEILIFNNELSQENMLNVGRYLSAKWNLIYSNMYVYNSTTTDAGRAYLLNLMNLREASPEEVTRAKEGATTGRINQFSPTFKVGPNERPVKVNEYGFDTGATEGLWVVPK
jgi:hypothetical protein